MSLVSRLCLVTGGGSGIGRAICRVLAREGASVAVVGHILSPAEETVLELKAIAEEKGHREALFHAFEVDVSLADQVQSLFGGLVDQFQPDVPLRAVINAAGIVQSALFLKLSERDFDDVISVNLKGTFLVGQAAVKLMLDQRVSTGSVVNIGSIVGKVGYPGLASYSASKGGITAMTLTMAKELGRFGIRCNAVLPGFIQTPMTDKIPNKLVSQLPQLTALGRIGRPEEIAEVCAFLASDRSSFVTGACVEATGGLAL